MFIGNRAPQLTQLGELHRPGPPMLGLHEKFHATFMKFQIGASIGNWTAALLNLITLSAVILAK